jgi:hypothetical protein
MQRGRARLDWMPCDSNAMTIAGIGTVNQADKQCFLGAVVAGFPPVSLQARYRLVVRRELLLHGALSLVPAVPDVGTASNKRQWEAIIKCLS